MASVQVGTETEGARGWSFLVHVTDDQGLRRPHTVELSWADYDYWCAGTRPPASVVAALMEFLLQRQSPDQLRPRFDAALVRRRWPEVDAALRGDHPTR